MFAGDSQTLRNKRLFVISVIAINVFYCNIHFVRQLPSNFKLFLLYSEIDDKEFWFQTKLQEAINASKVRINLFARFEI